MKKPKSAELTKLGLFFISAKYKFINELKSKLFLKNMIGCNYESNYEY